MLKSFGQLFFVNVFTFGLWGIAASWSYFAPNSVMARLFESFTILAISLPLAGLNLTLIVERIAKQHLTSSERLTLVALFSFTLPPLFLLGEFSLFHTIFPALPLFNTALVFLLAIILCPFEFERGAPQNSLPPKIYYGSLILAGIILLLVVAATVGPYYHLPESDPYYWLTKIQHEITTGLLPPAEAYRPLLSYLVYLFTVTAKVDLYAFFKYIMPCFLLLTLFPVNLITNRLPRAFDRVTFLLLPLSSASIVIYFLLPIPQSLINIIFTFFIFLLLHALFTKNNFFYFLAGATLCIGYLYHDITLLFLLSWFIVTLWYWRKTIIKKIFSHKFATLLVILLALSYYDALIPLVDFFKNWLVRIAPTIERFETNLAFPLAYTNIDGRAVGWGNYLGAIKYYLFYGGPTFLIIITLFSLIVFFAKQRVLFVQLYSRSKEFIILFSTFFLFFTLAEILPRLFNVALLPERALGFAGLVGVSMFPLSYFLIPKEWRKILVWFIFISLMINVGAALYINSLKRDLISPAKIASMQWIKNRLPSQRVVIVQYDLTVMKTFSQTEFLLEIPSPVLYTDITIFDQALQLSTVPITSLSTTYQNYLEQSRGHISYLASIDPGVHKNIPLLKKELKDFADETSDLLSQLPSDTLQKEFSSSQKPIYIYYAKQEQQSLYASRPYYKNEIPVNTFVFDTDKRFVKVYNDQANQIFIWKFNFPLP